MKYPRIKNLVENPQRPKKNPKDKGKDMTIPGQAMSLKDIVQRSISGFPVPMQREEIFLHPDLNQMLTGTKYDIVSDAKFRKMSKVERQRYINNIKGLKQGLQEKIDEQITKKETVDQQQTSTESTTEETSSP